MPEQPERRAALSTDAVIAICATVMTVAILAAFVLIAAFAR